MIIRIKFKNVGRHCQAGKSHHQTGNGHKNTDQPIICCSKKPFFGKEIDIEQANGETNINYNRRNDRLPPDSAHGVKIKGGRQWAISKRQWTIGKGQ